MPADTTHRQTATTDAGASTGRRARAFEGTYELDGDTSPDAVGPLSAPADCDSPEAYLREIRWRYANSPAVRQQLQLIARRSGRHEAEPITITGPYREQAQRIIDTLNSNRPGAI